VGLAITDDHTELAATVRRWAEARELRAEARAALEAPVEAPPRWWGEVADMGWLGLAVGVERGGQGYGLAELAVVLEELGRWCPPGPLLPTVVAAVAIDRWAGDAELARPLVDGTMVGGVALHGELVVEDSGRISGRVRGVWGGTLADRFVLPVNRTSEGVVAPAWCVVDRADLELKSLAGFDATRALAEPSATCCHRRPLPAAGSPWRWRLASAGRCRSSCRPRPSACGPRCGGSSRIYAPTTGRSGAADSPMPATWRPTGPDPGGGTPRRSNSW
jgi:hypothetical protein